jgi:metal-responsive CopG/Arc/MetJ family transcriptional regulator
MPGKTKKATISLPTDILKELDEAMSKGIAPSKNALVEQALLKELKEIRRQERQRIWQEGAKDRLLLKDIIDVDTAFCTADAEFSEGRF